MDLYVQLPSSSLILDPNYAVVLASLTKHFLTTVEVLSISSGELAKKVNRPLVEIQNFKNVLEMELKNAVDNQQNGPLGHRFLSTGDAMMDGILSDGNGLVKGHVVEVFGASSCGKSNFLMNLAVSVQGKSDTEVVYISTESQLQTRRLHAMVGHRNEISNSNKYSLERIHQVFCGDLESQDHILDFQLPILLAKRRNIGLIIIDSISHHIRVELESTTFKERTQRRNYLCKLGRRLHDMARQFDVCVVVSNQVSDKPLPIYSNQHPLNVDYQMGWFSGWNERLIRERQLAGDDEANYEKNGSTHAVVPTLSLDWAHSVDTRICVEKKYQPAINGVEVKQSQMASTLFIEPGDFQWLTKRNMRVVWSPFGTNQSVDFEILETGIAWVGGE